MIEDMTLNVWGITDKRFKELAVMIEEKCKGKKIKEAILPCIDWIQSLPIPMNEKLILAIMFGVAAA